MIGIISWKVGYNLQSLQLNVTGIYPPFGGGNPCGLWQLYDLQGNGHGFFLGFNRIEPEYAYIGNAPLYGFSLLDPRINSPDTENCVWPDRIDPSIVREGQTFYPLNFRISLSPETEKVKQGESFKVVADVEFSDVFSKSDSKGNLVYVYPISNSEQVTSTFELVTTTFEVSPSYESGDIGLGLSQPSRYSWIISPKEKTLGSQQLTVLSKLTNSNGEQAQYEFDIYLEVVDISGINPYVLGISSALITLIGGFFTVVKLIPESIMSYQKISIDKPNKKKSTKKGTTKGR